MAEDDGVMNEGRRCLCVCSQRRREKETARTSKQHTHTHTSNNTTPPIKTPATKAADALRVTGVGRNEYIALLNACRAKRLLWRVNRGLARDLLPAEEKLGGQRVEPWWHLQVANVGGSRGEGMWGWAAGGTPRAACRLPP